jgi:hypothetical protein
MLPAASLEQGKEYLGEEEYKEFQRFLFSAGIRIKMVLNTARKQKSKNQFA